jgi:hypothetical protein
MASALGYHGDSNVIGKEYFVRQAAILFGLAKATTDPKISAALLDKAADLKLQVDEPGAPPESNPPDIDPPAVLSIMPMDAPAKESPCEGAKG